MRKMLALVSSLLLIGVTQAYAATPVAAPAANTAAAQNIAVVNVQQLFQQSPKIADLNKQLQAKFKGRQDQLVADQKALQDEMAKYKKEALTMKQADKDAMQKKIGDDQSSLAKKAAAFQQDLNKEQNRVMKDVLSQLNTIISGVAKKNGYTLVLDSQAVIYAADGSDITKQVAKEFDGK